MRLCLGSLMSLCLVLLALPSALEAQEGTEAKAFEHVRVTWVESPATEARISWTTPSGGTLHRLHLDVVSHADQDPTPYAMTIDTVSSGAFSVDSSVEVTPFFHHTKLESLLPSTAYYLRVESDGVRSREYWFQTAPSDDRPFELLYGGDSRSDREDRQRMNARMKALFEAHPTILALWHGGDFVDRGGSWEDWDQWLEDHTATTLDSGRLLPVIPTRGNHEIDDALYNQIFAMPGGGRGQNYFQTTIGSTTLLTLDSEASVRGDQRDWLEQTLAAMRPVSRWLVAGYHTPAWPAVKIPGPVKAVWVPLFENYDLDLVCENDGHALKRTVPIRDDKQDPTGIVYIGEGGLGVKQRTPEAGRWYLQSPGLALSAHHVQILSFGPNALVAQAIGMDNEMLDRYERSPRPPFKLGPFTVLSVRHVLDRLYNVKLSHAINPQRFDPSTLTLLEGIRPSVVTLGKDQASVVLQFDPPLEPGKAYTLDLGEVYDFNNRKPQPQHVELIGGDYPRGYTPPEQDQGGGPADLGPGGPDMGTGADLGVSPVMIDMAVTSDDATRAALSGCAHTPARPAPAGLVLLGLGLLIRAKKTRKSPSSVSPQRRGSPHKIPTTNDF